jgi:hypothetical protein
MQGDGSASWVLFASTPRLAFSSVIIEVMEAKSVGIARKRLALLA